MEIENRTSRQGLRGLTGPAAIAAGAVIATAIVHVRDPHESGAYGFCPMYAITGLWCPACGGLRAVHDLTNWDLAAALGSNVLVVPAILAAFVVWIRWTYLRWTGSPQRVLTIGPIVMVVAVGVLVAFTVFRNTPWGSWLAPA